MKSASRAASRIPTSAAFTTSGKPTTRSFSPWSTWTAKTSHRCCAALAACPHDKAVEIARKICAGLAAAHDKGVLHRDLKPANIMLDGRGEVLIMDFGLAGVAHEIEDVRSGTPAYMAPEQIAGKEVTARSDIYSLGLVLYELFTGKAAFDGKTLEEIVRVRRDSTPHRPSTLVRDMDPAVERVILHCLEAGPRTVLPRR
jgi:serine/threonine protein kinase